MVKKSSAFIGIIGFFLIVLFSFGCVSAITGSIGNARMILRVDEGDFLEKTILVKNVNDVAVDIELFAGGDLEENIGVIDDKFTLQSGEEKRARITIDVVKGGVTTSQINVKFTPTDGGNGVGLVSTIIIQAEEDSFWDWGGDDGDDDGVDDTVGDNDDIITGDVVGGIDNGDGKSSGGVFAIVLIIVLLVLIVILLYVYSRKKKRFGGMRKGGRTKSLKRSAQKK